MDIVKDEHRAIIDEWFLNGFNGAKAVQEHRPEIGYGTARVLFNTIKKEAANAAYIQEKRQNLRAIAAIEPEQIVRELIQWCYSDATDYIGLSVDEVKALPSEVKRCIQSVKYRKKEYTDRKGELVTEEVMEIRIIDKAKTVEILNKMLGNYALDNAQKGDTYNIQNNMVGMNDQEKKEYLKALQLVLLQKNKGRG
jgi:phage terminase small subunit